jgi:beta-lactamase regulating signal transducer with metallopeptidase domain
MHFFNSGTIQALCWTLIHSLWQGLVLAIIAGIVVMGTKRSAVVFRYNILAGILFAFMLIAAGTFYIELNISQQVPGATSLETPQSFSIQSDYNSGQVTQANAPSAGIDEAIVSFLSANARVIVLIWLIVILYKCTKLVAGFTGMYMLKHRNTSGAGDYWNARINELASTLYISKRIKLLQSAIIKIPMVIGYFKPVILVPAGMLTGLPVDEVEAILLHELAHIRRKDYLVNLVQNFCEILFFFNPAILWISSLIKEERENCCDEIAISKVKDKDRFINALISFQEYNLSNAQYAVAFQNNRYQLLNRVKRIITNNNKTLNAMEKSLLATGMVVIGFVAITFSQSKDPSPQNNRNDIAVNQVQASAPLNSTNQVNEKNVTNLVKDTVPEKERSRVREGRSTFSISTTRDGKDYEIIGEGENEVIRLYIDGVRIPDNKIADYKEVVDQIIKETREQARKARQEAQIARERAQADREQAAVLRQQLRMSAMESQRSLRAAELARIQAERDRRHTELIIEKAERAARAQNSDNAEKAERAKIQAEKLALDDYSRAKIAELQKEQAERSMQLQKLSKEQAELVHRRSELFRMSNDARRRQAQLLREHSSLSRIKAGRAREESQKLIKGIIEDLKMDGIVKETENISFSINNKELIVNGKKQSDAVHQKFRMKYLKGESDNINYSRDGNTSHSHISINDDDDNKKEPS